MLIGKSLMKTRKNPSWMPHPDVSVDAAFSNQVWMADVLQRVGLLAPHCYGADVPLSFHPAATRVLGLVTPRSVG